MMYITEYKWIKKITNVQENVKFTLARLLLLLKAMREEGNSIRKDLQKQTEELAELNEDIEETKSSLLEIKVTITLASLEFETYWNNPG